MAKLDRFHGLNAAYVVEHYQRYLDDPSSVSEEDRRVFDTWRPDDQNMRSSANLDRSNLRSISSVVELARAIRSHGHLTADINPVLLKY